MGEEVEKHILRKYELLQKLGKGVRSHRVDLLRAGAWKMLICPTI